MYHTLKQKKKSCDIIHPRKMVCFKYIIVNALHKSIKNKDNNKMRVEINLFVIS